MSLFTKAHIPLTDSLNYSEMWTVKVRVWLHTLNYWLLCAKPKFHFSTTVMETMKIPTCLSCHTQAPRVTTELLLLPEFTNTLLFISDFMASLRLVTLLQVIRTHLESNFNSPNKRTRPSPWCINKISFLAFFEKRADRHFFPESKLENLFHQTMTTVYT